VVVVMASATRSADALINYALDDKPNQKGERYVMASGLNGLLVSLAKPQMRDVRKKWGKDRAGAFVQAYHVIQSFGLDELSPESPDSWMTAQRLGSAVAEDRFPGRQVLVVTQRDGKTGCLHNHIVVNSVETRTGKSLDSSVVMHSRLVEAHERVLEAEGFEQRPDLKRAFSDAAERYERGEPSGLRRAGSTTATEEREFQQHILWGVNCDLADEFGFPHDPEPFSLTMLKWSIQRAIEDPESIDWASFVAAGDRHGARIEQRGKKGRGITYGMLRKQPDGTFAEPSASDRRRCTTLGAEFEMDAVEQAFASHLEAQAAVTAPVTRGIRLTLPPAVQGKSIEERLRDAMAEIDKQFGHQQPFGREPAVAEKATPARPTPPETRDVGDEAAKLPIKVAPPPAPSAEAADGSLRDVEGISEVTPRPESAGAAIGAPVTASLAEELRTINQRNRRLGLPLLTREELVANRAMSPEQRKFRLKHPELLGDQADASADIRRGREFGD
jgi:hypothetical protein